MQEAAHMPLMANKTWVDAACSFLSVAVISVPLAGYLSKSLQTDSLAVACTSECAQEAQWRLKFDLGRTYQSADSASAALMINYRHAYATRGRYPCAQACLAPKKCRV